ncbi:replication endonuclease [Sulfurovum sp.]|uniref:replication endonuclease n=1 Tax=Sulfurovum sp. TaxID=1969726 RepID=UPI002867BE47|nr:replication endonuclease [Sulfurovum sp.]
MSKNYGLSFGDLQNVRKKIKKQEDFLTSNTFLTENGEFKSLLDVSYSANLSKRYYPRILNKVNTFVSLGLNQGLVPIFLTVTLDGFFRDLIKGDYSRFTPGVREKYIKHIPNNERSGFYLDYMDKKSVLTPKDLYKILGHQMHRFTKSTTLQNIRKQGLDYSMIRVTEPHEDGVPHFHILMYVPGEYIPNIFKEFVRYFPAPQNHKTLTLKNTSGHNKRNGAKIDDGIFETKGFQTQVRSAAGYILKYILKSFTNLIEEKEIDYLQAWYVHNRIPRLITTRTLIGQDVYHKIGVLEGDWYYLSNIKIDGGYVKDSDNNYFKFVDGVGRQIIGDNGLYMISYNGKIVARYGTKDNMALPVYRLRSLKFSATPPDNFNVLYRYIIWLPPRQYSYYITKSFKDDHSCAWIGNKDDAFFIFDTSLEYEYFFKPQKEVPIKKLPDYQLYEQYANFDFEKNVSTRYAKLHNELIDRGLLRLEPLNLNDYNSFFYDELHYKYLRKTMSSRYKSIKERMLGYE